MGCSIDFVMVLITTGSEEEADSIARQLVEHRMAACANSVNGGRSLFWWQGKTDSAHETLLFVKTRASLLSRLLETVKKAQS